MSKKILIVDDEESIRFTFETFLSDEGYAVATARDYEQALDQIRRAPFDVIFADIVLGGKTGVDLLQEVRKRNLSCPLVMITGVPDVQTSSEAVRLGAFDYIPKPVVQETLLQVTRKALRHKALLDEKEGYRSNLEAIFRSVRAAIILVDQELKVLEMNQAASTLFQLPREQVVGKPFAALAQDCSRRCLEVLEETIRTQRPADLNRVECSGHDRPGKVVSMTASPVLNPRGRFSGAVLVIRDDTRLAGLERDLRERHQFHDIVGQNQKFQKLYSLIEDLADVQTTVLITGESGTGKELVAEALHYQGVRNKRPLVKVNCSALPEDLLESELFGHVKGAFTGAVRDKIGRFQLAHGGTIFLDEIGDISSRMQLRLLRVLQEMEFERVGESVSIQVDVRVVAATNQDLQERVRSGEFREDLYYRLKVVEVNLPPLRERRDDIPLLTEHFLDKFNRRFNKGISAVSKDVEKIFMESPWPGNVRELEHALEHAFIVCHQDIITLDHLPPELCRSRPKKPFSPLPDGAVGPETIAKALEKTGWNKSRAARLLGISRRTIYRKLEEYSIQHPESDQ